MVFQVSALRWVDRVSPTVFDLVALTRDFLFLKKCFYRSSHFLGTFTFNRQLKSQFFSLLCQKNPIRSLFPINKICFNAFWSYWSCGKFVPHNDKFYKRQLHSIATHSHAHKFTTNKQTNERMNGIGCGIIQLKYTIHFCIPKNSVDFNFAHLTSKFYAWRRVLWLEYRNRTFSFSYCTECSRSWE